MIDLNTFRQHFKGHEDKYVIIGGTACSVLLNEIAEDFRATKDVDVVLIIENCDEEFFLRFWQFINLGQYNNAYKGERKLFYRFENPGSAGFPLMIEVFSRKPDGLELFADAHLTPLYISEDIFSLSAILLDDDYYKFMLGGRKIIDGISVLDSEHLIAFKAKAWLDMNQRRQNGEGGLSKHIKKHKRDIATLLFYLDPGLVVEISGRVREDMICFLNAVKDEATIHPNYHVLTPEVFCERLCGLYNLEI